MILKFQFCNLFVLHATAFLINISSNISVGSPLLLPVITSNGYLQKVEYSFYVAEN